MSNKILQKIPDLLEEGLIAINSSGIIKLYNNQAKNILGLNPQPNPGHPPGSLEANDIVLIATNNLGCDDGQLKPSDLEKIGIAAREIELGDMFVGIGVAGQSSGSGVFARQKASSSPDPLTLVYDFDQFRVQLGIYPQHKLIRIEVDKINFDLSYNYCLCNMVILDAKTKKVKFYQSRGHTIRKEEAKNILYGTSYQGKGAYAPKAKLINQHIATLHQNSMLIKAFLKTAAGENRRMSSIEGSINNIPVFCNIIPIQENNRPLGALLQLWDINQVRKMDADRSQAINSLTIIEKDLSENTEQKGAFKSIIGFSQQIKESIYLAQKAAATDSTVLITGESGTGKGLLANSIHQASRRNNKPFITVDCTAIPPTLLESELFGYEEGAFTGAAIGGKKGRFELAKGGTLFLDEIAEMPTFLQAKLLHVLQEKEFHRIGGLKPISLDARIIAATNQNLTIAINKGSFREDLYYRLNIIPIQIPPLRERPEDLYPLKNHLLPKICQALKTNPKEISSQAMRFFLHYAWRGNVRELENVLERACNMVEGDYIYPEHLPEYLLNEKKHHLFAEANLIEKDNYVVGPLKNRLEQTEKNTIEQALKAANGSRKKAIQLLQIGKTAFYQKLKKYNLS